MPQKHPQARDRSQRLGSLKHAQTMPVSVLEVAGPDDVADLFAFFVSLLSGTYLGLPSPHQEITPHAG